MDLLKETHSLLRAMGKGRILSTTYDTAWVAKLIEIDYEISALALSWLREHQLPDGSWGTNHFVYHHERLANTLAAIIAFSKVGDPKDRPIIQRALVSLEKSIIGLPFDSAGETIAFEMIVPAMWHELMKLGVVSTKPVVIADLDRRRAEKINALPDNVINQHVTHAFSAEMVGTDGIHLLDKGNLLQENGSVGNSPAATAHYLLNVASDDARAWAYLRGVVGLDSGGLPDIAPFDVFERGWVVWNFSLLESIIDDSIKDLCQPHADFLAQAWKPGEGIGFSAEYSVPDGDCTGIVYDTLLRCGRDMDLQDVLYYEEPDYFRCFPYEANPSISTNVHVLGALRQAGLPPTHPSVQKIFSYLEKNKLGAFWLDKWHVSPYYPTAHLIISSTGYNDTLIKDAIDWLIATQRSDGAWGYYLSTAEETAYSLQSLAMWKRNGGHIPRGIIERGVDWLKDHFNDPYPPLWIGKCLYNPVDVNRSSIMSAIMLTQEHTDA